VTSRSPIPSSAESKRSTEPSFGTRLRTFLRVFVPSLLILAGLVAAIHRVDLEAERRVREREATSLVELQQTTIVSELASVRSDLRFLATERDIRAFASAPDSSDAGEIARAYALFGDAKGRYDQIRFLDLEGRERIRVNFRAGGPRIVPPDELQAKGDRYYVESALRLGPGEVFVSRFDLNVEHGRVERPIKPVIRFAAPVFDASGERRGILVLNYLGDRLLSFLDDLARSFAGRAMLLDFEGYWLIGPNPDDAWGFVFDESRSFRHERPEIWDAMAGRDEGVIDQGGDAFAFRKIDVAGGLTLVAHTPREVIRRRPGRVLARLVVLSSVMAILLGGFAVAHAQAAATRRSQEARLRDSEARLRKLTTSLIDAQENERKRISRDLHDDLGQIVTAVALSLEKAECESDDEERRRRSIRRALEATGVLLERVHEISSRLRPPVLDDLGLVDALQDLAATFESDHELEVRTEIETGGRKIPDEISQAVYRIAQEALLNVGRHARARRAELFVDADADRILVCVRDDGRGFARIDPNAGRLGVLGMRERAELLGGTFRIESAAGEGTSVEVELPLDPGSNRDVEEET